MESINLPHAEVVFVENPRSTQIIQPNLPHGEVLPTGSLEPRKALEASFEAR